MIEVAKLIVFEVCYCYWAAACGYPTREEYAKTRLLK